MKKQLNGNFLFYSCCYFNYEKALQIDSNTAWNGKGIALDNLGKYEKAIEW